MCALYICICIIIFFYFQKLFFFTFADVIPLSIAVCVFFDSFALIPWCVCVCNIVQFFSLSKNSIHFQLPLNFCYWFFLSWNCIVSYSCFTSYSFTFYFTIFHFHLAHLFQLSRLKWFVVVVVGFSLVVLSMCNAL